VKYFYVTAIELCTFYFDRLLVITNTFLSVELFYY